MAEYETMEEGMPVSPSGAASAGMEGSANAAPPEGEAKSVFIPSDYLPEGIKSGDVLRVASMDEDGCTCVHEPGEDEEGEGREGWENDLRKELSPREPQQEAM